MTNAMKRNPRGGNAPRVMLYALGVIVALMAALLVKTTAIDNNGLSKSASLASFNPLTVAPIANQSANTGVPVSPISPTATDSQTSPYPVITWTASGLPPGITISRSSGLITGVPTLAGTYQVTITAKDNAHPPTYGYASFNWYIGNMAPVITKVVPVVSQGVGGIRVVITGKNFANASSVTFGGVDAGSLTVNRVGTRIVTYAPPESAGTVDVAVTAVGGTSAPAPADQFTYLAPHITVVSNVTGSTTGGTRVRISGTGLGGATAVSFGGVPSADFRVRHNGTLLTAVAPPNSTGTVTITVTTPGGTAQSGGHYNFTYVVPTPAPATHKK
jgi:large repetitive protein